jgi:transcription elongation factor Elf1
MNRKNIKVNEDTFEKLQSVKHKYETWDRFFYRLVDEIDDKPTCHECGSESLTMEDIGAGQEALKCKDCGATLQVG